MSAPDPSAMREAAHDFIADPSPQNEERVRFTSAMNGIPRHAIEKRVASLRGQAAIAGPCERCGGSGRYLDCGVCFDCGGSGEQR